VNGPQDRDDGDRFHQEATASGDARVYQAGRDQHLIFSTGTQRTNAAPGSAEAQCPYPGLTSFTADQAKWFFGRDRLVATLVSRLDACRTEGGPVMVVAASGTGKSSLLLAGLLPKVAAGALTSAGPPVVFTPGAHPMRAAADALRAALPGTASDATAPAAEAPSAAMLDGLLATVGAHARPVLVVDQFEELFRLCEHEDERGSFISWLWRATSRDPAGGTDGPAVLAACAMRADFYPQCTRYPQLRQALQGSQVIVGAMSPDELREAIICPAEAVDLEIQPGLTELLLADLHVGASFSTGDLAEDDGAGRLPLLAHVLRVIWQQRNGSTLTVAGYRAAGGIENAIADSAEQVFGRLDDMARLEARRVFLRLVKIGATSGVDVRRPVSREDLTDASTGAGARAVIDAYVAARLLTQSLGTVQISHEALLRAWPRLAGWLNDDRAGQLTRQRTEDDADEWEQADRDPSLLYRGARLETAVSWAAGHGRDLSAAAQKFLAASRRVARRNQRVQRSVLIVLTVLLLVAAVATPVAFVQRSDAISQTHRAQSEETTAQSAERKALSEALSAKAISMDATSPYTARQVAIAAGAISLTPDSSQAAWTLLAEQPGTIATDDGDITSVAVSPTTGFLATAGSDGEVRLWDTATGRQVGPTMTASSDGSQATDVAFNPAGTLLATAGGDGTVRLWNPATQEQVGTTITPEADGTPSSVAFNLAGTLLATAGGDGTVQLWNPATQEQVGTTMTVSGESEATDVAFNPAGTLLATAGSDGTARLWNPATQEQVGTAMTASKNGGVNAVSFNPAGTLLATAGNDGTARLWNPATQEQVGDAMSADSGGYSASSVAFNKAGTVLATAEFDGSVRLWNPATQQQLSTTISTEDGPVAASAAAFSPSGTLLATGEGDGKVRLWNPVTRQLVGTITATSNGSPVFSVAFNSAGTLLATGGGDGKVRLWNPGTDKQVGTTITAVNGSTDAMTIAFNGSGTRLATTGGDGSVRLWNPENQKQVGVTITSIEQDGAEHSLAFNRAGTMIATADGAYGEAWLWNTATAFDNAAADLTSQPQYGSVIQTDATFMNGVAFNPAGTLLATANGDGTVDLWYPATGQQMGADMTVTSSSAAQAVAFNNTGKLLATAGGDGTIRLWDVGSQRQVGVSTRDPGNNAAYSVTFNQAGTMVAAGFTGGDFTIASTSWQLDPYGALCREFGLPPAAIWKQYAGSQIKEPARCPG
jgi:WD40 repeat protein